MLLLEQDTIMKRQINKIFSEPKLEFDVSNNKKYEIKAIKDSDNNAKKTKGHLPGLYYLVSSKSYLEKENIQK